MTLVLKLDLDIVKMYVCTKDEALTSNGSKVIAWTDTQTDRWTDRQTDGQTDRQTDRQMDRQTHRQTRLKLLPSVYADGNNLVHLSYYVFDSIWIRMIVKLLKLSNAFFLLWGTKRFHYTSGQKPQGLELEIMQINLKSPWLLSLDLPNFL